MVSHNNDQDIRSMSKINPMSKQISHKKNTNLNDSFQEYSTDPINSKISINKSI